MNLLVLGATGATGRQLVPQALAAGHRLRALVRGLMLQELASGTWMRQAPTIFA